MNGYSRWTLGAAADFVSRHSLVGYCRLWLIVVLGTWTLSWGGLVELRAQAGFSLFSLSELRRMQRLRPASPYDLGGDYRLMEYWEHQARLTGDTLQTPSLLGDIVLGKIVPLGRKWEIGLDGLVDVWATSNKVDGMWLGYEIFAAYNIAQGHRLVLRSAHAYTTKGRQYMTNNRILYFYAPAKGGVAILAGGVTSIETVHTTNEEEYTRAHLLPLGPGSEGYDYRKRYASLRNSIYLTSALRSDALMVYEYRTPQRYISGAAHHLLHGELRLAYDFSPYGSSSADFPTPHRLPRGFFRPEVSAVYRWQEQLWNDTPTQDYSTWMSLGAGIRMSYALADDQLLDWAIAGEHFIGGDAQRTDAGLRLPGAATIDRKPIAGTFSTADHLALRTGGWLWGLANYTSGRLMLTQLPGLRRIQLDEGLHLRGMLSYGRASWLEFGYSVGLGEMLRVGLFGGTNLHGQSRWAFRLSLPILYLTGRASTRY